MKKWMHNLIKAAAAGAMTLMMVSTAFASGWMQDQGTGLWQYDLGNGQHYTLESYDLTGKMILPFCTSGRSDVEKSMETVRNSSGNGMVGTGLTANNVSTQEIQNWLQENGI